MRHRRVVSCSSGPNSITTAKSSAVLQRLSRSSPWRQLFWRQLPLTFCANRLELSASILMSALPPKADMCVATRDVRFGPIADILKSHGLQQSGRPRIRFSQKQGCKLFVFAQEFFDVILHLNTGMDNRPKMGGSDKSKKRQDILEALAAKDVSQCV